MNSVNHPRELESARWFYELNATKPPFVQEKRMVRDGERKEVILPTVHGALPDNPDAPRGQITARVLPWDENFIYWTMDVGRETCIVKPVGRVGRRAAYRRWLGVGMKNIRDGFGQDNMAFTISPSVLPARSLENDRADLENDRADLENDLTDLGNDLADPANESDDSSFITTTEAPNTSLLQDSMVDAPNRKRTRTASRVEIPKVSHGSIILEHAIQQMLENDHQYYNNKGVRPPFVSCLKNIKTAAIVNAYLVGKDGKETREIVTIKQVEWKPGEIYWLADIRNEQQVLARLPGGRNGSRFFKWRGHSMKVDSSRIVAIPLSEAEVKAMTPEATASTGRTRLSRTTVNNSEAPHDDLISSEKGRCLPKGFRPAFSVRPKPTFRKLPSQNPSPPTFEEARMNTNKPRLISFSGIRTFSDGVEDESTLERPSKRSRRTSATRQFDGHATTEDLSDTSSPRADNYEPSVIGKGNSKEVSGPE